MKKFLLVIALAAIIATGTVFADHPDGFGIGLVGSYGLGLADYAGAGGGLSLKIPNVPIFWTINGSFGVNYFGVGLTGDYYIIDSKLADMIHWFFGVGAFFNWWHWSWTLYGSGDYTYDNLSFGARVPIGISFQPIPMLEIFADVAPALGAYMNGKYKIGNVEYGGGLGFYWGVPFEVGIRLWF